MVWRQLVIGGHPRLPETEVGARGTAHLMATDLSLEDEQRGLLEIRSQWIDLDADAVLALSSIGVERAVGGKVWLVVNVDRAKIPANARLNFESGIEVRNISLQCIRSGSARL